MGRRSDAALHGAWRRRWERFEGSSVTVAEFCRREGVSAAAFYQWRKRLTREAAAAEKRTVAGPPATHGPTARREGHPTGFVELTLASLAVVELDLPNGVRVRVPADQEAALGAAIRAAGELAGHPDASGKEAARC